MNDNYTGQTAIYAGMSAPSALTPLELFIQEMQAGTFAQYNDTNIRQPVLNPHFNESYAALETDNSRLMSNWTNKYSWIAEKKRIVGVGTSEGYTGNMEGRFRSKSLSFDFSDNQFKQAWNPSGRPEGHGYDANCSIPLNGKLYRKAFLGNIVTEYDQETQLWTDKFSIAGFTNLGSVWSLDVLPSLGSSGSVIMIEDNGARLLRYDLATNQLTNLGAQASVGNHNICVLVNNSIIFGCGIGSNTLYKMSSSGAITLLSNSVPMRLSTSSGTGPPAMILPHPSINHLAIIFDRASAGVWHLDTNTGQFEQVGTYNANLAGSGFVAPTSLIGLSAVALWRGRGRDGNGVNQSEFWIYKV